MIKVCALMYSVALATFYPIVLDLFLSKKRKIKNEKGCSVLVLYTTLYKGG